MLNQPTSADPVTAVLYVYGVFDGSSNWENFEEWIGYIQNSHFNIVVFSTFHVDSNGNLYGSVPLVSNGVFNPQGGVQNPYLFDRQFVRHLRRHGIAEEHSRRSFRRRLCEPAEEYGGPRVQSRH